MSLSKIAFGSFVVCSLLAVAATGCSSAQNGEAAKASTAEELSDGSFKSSWKIVGSLDYGQTSDAVDYTGHPKYRAFKFAGNEGDHVDVWVRSQDGDAVAWVLDNDFTVLGHNDDASDDTLDAHVKVTLPANPSATHYVVFREYDKQHATFTVQLDGTPAPDFGACQTDADCVAVQKVACCPNGSKIALTSGDEKAYASWFACTNPPASCPLFVINDTRVAECNAQTNHCEMVAIDQIKCGGFIRDAHQCPAGYDCNHLGSDGVIHPDIPGTCTPKPQ